MRITRIFTVLLIILPVALILLIIFQYEPHDHVSALAEARVMEVRALPQVTSTLQEPQSNVASLEDQKGNGGYVDDQKRSAASLGLQSSSQHLNVSIDKLLDGLLAAGFDEDSCLSRYQSILYRKISPRKPSQYLLSKLRKYEDLHKRCGPSTRSYYRATKLLESSQNIGSADCKYVVWMSYSGLGNRIITIASAFLYALLTDRVLLVEGGEQISGLFCEPFLDTSWLLPSNFPIISQFSSFDQNSARCYGKMLKKNMINASIKSLPPYIYLHLAHNYDDYDKMFFCDRDQAFIGKVPWLIMKTNNYFVPSLFLLPSFENELQKLFPDKSTVFHHLGRYLFHPTNHVWGLVKRYYQAYLARADERIGIQVRVFDEKTDKFLRATHQIIACTTKEKLLPEVDKKESAVVASANPKTKAVLVTSLTSGYYENLKSMYWEYPTVTGDVIAVHQPSHEGHQQTEKLLHNKKAWAEIYLLSLTDSLVTSAGSTFGYVAQGLGGLRPWILYKAENGTNPDPPCSWAISMEPCFHAPPFYDCKEKRGIDTGKLVPHVRHCEDVSWGLKVVDD
ncbi:fucosyltransferase 2-like [Carica papaya]|uniref:fucosyltransferase 2-like n=1 Tax=Carica papaya TaxID=3649 RepID=UPI000B8CA2B3|nr:fucosyltransferase 2-like [Carica papaya]